MPQDTNFKGARRSVARVRASVRFDVKQPEPAYFGATSRSEESHHEEQDVPLPLSGASALSLSSIVVAVVILFFT